MRSLFTMGLFAALALVVLTPDRSDARCRRRGREGCGSLACGGCGPGGYAGAAYAPAPGSPMMATVTSAAMYGNPRSNVVPASGGTMATPARTYAGGLAYAGNPCDCGFGYVDYGHRFRRRFLR